MMSEQNMQGRERRGKLETWYPTKYIADRDFVSVLFRESDLELEYTRSVHCLLTAQF